MAKLAFEIKPSDAADIAEITVDGQPIVGRKLEVPWGTKRVNVSVIALGYTRLHKDVEIPNDDAMVDVKVKLDKRTSTKKKTVAVTVGMGALSVLAWLVRRR